MSAYPKCDICGKDIDSRSETCPGKGHRPPAPITERPQERCPGCGGEVVWAIGGQHVEYRVCRTCDKPPADCKCPWSGYERRKGERRRASEESGPEREPSNERTEEAARYLAALGYADVAARLRASGFPEPTERPCRRCGTPNAEPDPSAPYRYTLDDARVILARPSVEAREAWWEPDETLETAYEGARGKIASLKRQLADSMAREEEAREALEAFVRSLIRSDDERPAEIHGLASVNDAYSWGAVKARRTISQQARAALATYEGRTDGSIVIERGVYRGENLETWERVPGPVVIAYLMRIAGWRVRDSSEAAARARLTLVDGQPVEGDTA